MSDMRDWLILSTKRNSDEMCWHAEGCCGYTLDLTRAGRFTEAEAKAEEARVPHCNLAVPLMVALSMARTWITVENGGGQMETLRRLIVKHVKAGQVGSDWIVETNPCRRLCRDCGGCRCLPGCDGKSPCRCDSPVVGHVESEVVR